MPIRSSASPGRVVQTRSDPPDSVQRSTAADWLLYAGQEQINEATSMYLQTLAAAAQPLGLRLRHVTSLRDVGARDRVLAVECKSAFKVALTRPQARVWLWMQGLYPEEARLHFSSRAREWLQRRFERFALPRVRGAVMVSEAMRAHFRALYPGLALPSSVMPCVNSRLDESCFAVPGKYDRPSFVYAGSLHAWQCVAKTLAVFQRVREALPDATLSIFTRDVAAARSMVDAAGLSGVDVAFVPLAELQGRLARFKYGFVLREDHIVNRVATPTKVSSYMAAGVIPVMTAAVQDYARALHDTEPLVMAVRLDPDLVAAQVLVLEKSPLRAADVLRVYRQVFADYFDLSTYVEGLREFFERTGLAESTTHTHGQRHGTTGEAAS